MPDVSYREPPTIGREDATTVRRGFSDDARVSFQ
jgi:hypothetical protein